MLILLIDITTLNVALPRIAAPEWPGLHHRLLTPTVRAFDLMLMLPRRRP
jgi:hypothetical protein